jgi:transposase InsO family protein
VLGTDLFEWQKHTHLLIVDYFSRWIEIARLDQPTANAVIQHTSSIFARHGIPEVVVSDNGPQYASEAYSNFAESYGFKHITSSPYYPQSNGEQKGQ